MAMIGGFDMSYKAWDQSGAGYQVPNPEYDDWVQGIIIALQVTVFAVSLAKIISRSFPVYQS